MLNILKIPTAEAHRLRSLFLSQRDGRPELGHILAKPGATLNRRRLSGWHRTIFPESHFAKHEALHRVFKNVQFADIQSNQ